MTKELVKYQCHKQVHAMPMTRGEYNTYRGWLIPENEDPSDEGYLVVYGKGTPDHYESWTPKKQFDDGYTVYSNRVTPERIQRLVDQLEYKFERVGNSTVTGCWAFLSNGFQVGFGQSACVDPENYNQELGEKYAKASCIKDAEDTLWELEGYRLAQQLNPV